MRPVSSWGRLNAPLHNAIDLKDPGQFADEIAGHLPGITHGMGRSYGDECLNPKGNLWKTNNLDHLLQFDETTGLLVCESGTLLGDIQKIFFPRGWALPVTPGTQFVTVGGAIANDVHGKNHHLLGSFGNHVEKIKLIRTDGRIIECGMQLNEDWFAATVGGMGLTGFIAEAAIQLKKVPGPCLDVETVPYFNLDEFFGLADGSERDWEYTVSWIDCTSRAGRGIFMRANHAAHAHTESNKRKRAMPRVSVPLVHPLSLRLFNMVYFQSKKRGSGRHIMHYEPFFYPLDTALEWNRLYGPAGFYQYQSVIPRESSRESTQAMLDAIAESGEGSFLAVLKTFGNKQARGMMSFPRPGVTLALDFANRGEKTLKLFDYLDAIVREAGGRIYAAKDARMPRDLFETGYPQFKQFLNYRDAGISSAMSRRLMGI